MSRGVLIFVLLIGCALVGGCQGIRGYQRHVAKPIVAVTDFENRSGFSGQWNLGPEMADLLTAALMESGRFTVLERRQLRSVLDEILRQGTDWFRREGRVARGRLKNAQYLIRGSITDFGETGGASAAGRAGGVRIFGFGRRARVALVLHVVDVETGEIIASVKTARSVSARGFGGEGRYKDVAFGGDVFFRTPLGRATEGALRDAVRRLTRAISPTRWEPRVAEVTEQYVILNGGANVGVRPGQVFLVRAPGRTVVDPVTGNPLETVPGPVVGRVEVTEVKPTSAHATLVEGRARRGDHLEPASRTSARARQR